MKFRTEVRLEKAPFKLDTERQITLLGSCFADNIGSRIDAAGWPCCINPCGVVYNPASIALLLQLALTHRSHRRVIIESSLTQREGKFVSWLVDSKCAANTAEKCTDLVCEAIDRLEASIEKSDSLSITFGTPDVWLLKDTDRLVCNCHKHPAKEFQKHRLGIDDIADTWIALSGALRERNPEIKIIFTVSPRRYLGEGAADNSRLKAILLLASQKICDTVPSCTYFPAYELLIDDLRDYRFYAPDMLHPSSIAVDYIWENFKTYFLDRKDAEALEASTREARRANHRPIL